MAPGTHISIAQQLSPLSPPPSPSVRLKQFPRGLGKGSDSAVMGRWLETILREMARDETLIPVTWSINMTC